MGYLNGLNRIEVVRDKDQWNCGYYYESDTIEIQRKMLADGDTEKTRTLLHEAGHRAQYRADKAAFRAFQKAKLDTHENFMAMANAVHWADFHCSGYVEDLPGETFAESYAHWALGHEMPIGLRDFWDNWASRGEASDSVIPFVGATDAEWDESKHPRGPGGQFGTGGKAAAPKAEKGAKPKASHVGGPNATPHKPFAKLHPSSLTQVSGKMGSNEGGIYKDKSGTEFYVKKPKGMAQVANENAAARLYQLAGLNTFEYMDAGPSHVATKVEKLDKNNIKQLSPEEKKAAQKDFMTHAWLANWDAAGTGGDNVGVVGGKIKVLDVGGALEYRAQGEAKGDAFGAQVNETINMLNPDKSPDAAWLYGGMTKEQKIESAKLVTEIPNNAIIETVKAAGGSDELINKLIARKNDIADQMGLTPAGATNPEWEAAHPRGPGGKFVAKPGGEEEGAEPEMGIFANYSEFQDQVLTQMNEDDLAGVQQLGMEYPDWADKMAKSINNPKIEFYLNKGINQSQGFAPGEAPPIGAPAAVTAESDSEAAKIDPTKFKTKKELIGALLTAKGGVSMKQVLDMTGWPSVSMPAQAAAAGMKLEKKKNKEGVVMYVGTPLTAEEKAANKAAAKAKIAQKAAAPAAPAPAPAKPAAPPKAAPAAPEPPKVVAGAAAYPPPTEAELNKAKKPQPLQMQYIPGEKPMIDGGEYKKKADELLKDFNDKYSGKDLTSKEDLTGKVNDFKTLGKQMGALAAQENVNKAAIQKAAAEEAKKKAAETQAAAKQKEAEEKAKFAAQNAEITKQLGITDPDQLKAFDAFVDHFGGVNAAMGKFKQWQKTAEAGAKAHPNLGYEKLTPFEMGCIWGYTGPESDWINSAILGDAATPAQHMYEQVLNSAIDKLPKVSGKIVRRGLSLPPEVHAKLKPGMVWTHRNFASSNEKGWGGNTKLHISTTGKGGAYVDPISANKGEGETLFKSNLKLYIDKVEKVGTTLHVHCKEM